MRQLPSHGCGCATSRSGVADPAAQGVFAHQKLRKRREEILERLQVRGAAEKIVQHFVLNVRHQLDEHVVGFGLVFNQRILLRISAQINAFAQRIHRIQMLLPEPIDRVENDVTLQAFHRRRFFVRRFALVGVLDFLDQELRICLRIARFELGASLFRPSGKVVLTQCSSPA